MSRRKRYSAEFKREALRRANEEGVTFPSTTTVSSLFAISVLFQTAFIVSSLCISNGGYLILYRFHGHLILAR